VVQGVSRIQVHQLVHLSMTSKTTRPRLLLNRTFGSVATGPRVRADGPLGDRAPGVLVRQKAEMNRSRMLPGLIADFDEATLAARQVDVLAKARVPRAA
jgi:hypothetical protein